MAEISGQLTVQQMHDAIRIVDYRQHDATAEYTADQLTLLYEPDDSPDCQELLHELHGDRAQRAPALPAPPLLPSPIAPPPHLMDR